MELAKNADVMRVCVCVCVCVCRCITCVLSHSLF